MTEIMTNQKGGVFEIVINRPKVKNALNTHTRVELCKAIQNAQSVAKVIIIRGAEGDFCAGQDLADFASHKSFQDIDGIKILEEEYEPILNAIEASKIPVIAAVEGACVGAGMSLAIACDLVIAAHSAYFQLAFAKIGLVPDVGASYHLPRLIGRARAMGMALTAEKVSADSAQDMGLIWKSVAHAEFEKTLSALTSQLAHGPSQAYDGIRKLIRQSQNAEYGAQMSLEAKLQNQALHSQDFHEGVTAFMEKRPPKYQGK